MYRTLKVVWRKDISDYAASGLREIFDAFGTVEDVVIRDGKRRKGSALVVFADAAQAERAGRAQCGDAANPLLAVRAATEPRGPAFGCSGMDTRPQTATKRPTPAPEPAAKFKPAEPLFPGAANKPLFPGAANAGGGALFPGGAGRTSLFPGESRRRAAEGREGCSREAEEEEGRPSASAAEITRAWCWTRCGERRNARGSSPRWRRRTRRRRRGEAGS